MSLYEKMYNVMCETEGLEKNLEVGAGNSKYKAIGEAEVLNMMKPLFKKYKLIIFPVDGEITEQNSTFETENQGKITTKTRNVTQLKIKFKIVDIETGESDYLMSFGNGADSQDKGSGKAFTYAFKAVLSKSFMLFSGEDTDNEHSDDLGNPETDKKPPKIDLKEAVAKLYTYATKTKKMTPDQYKQLKEDLKKQGKISNFDDRKWTEEDAKAVQEALAS